MQRRLTDSGRIRGTTPEIDAVARELRRRMTVAERVLWNCLRAGRLGGLRFRRQHPVGRFILDFYCPSRKLAIEIDGPIHDDQAEHDAARTARLEANGYRVLRFRNEEVLANLGDVLARIARAAEQSLEDECLDGGKATDR